MNIRKRTKEDVEKEKLNNDKKQGGFSVGTSLVLVTFVLIALVTFGTISYVQAKSDLKLTEEAITKTNEYYEANTRAQERLAAINVKLKALQEGQIDNDEYFEAVRYELTNDGFTVTEDMTGLYVSYRENINETSDIEVKIKVSNILETGIASLDSRANEAWSAPVEYRITTISEWKTVNKGDGAIEEEEEEPLHLIF